MQELSRKQMRLEHQKLWRWLAENFDKEKHQWPGWEELEIDTYRDEDYQAACFACVAAPTDEEGGTDCYQCPIKWTDGGCMSHNSEYMQWRNARCEDRHKAAHALALKIADMWPEEG